MRAFMAVVAAALWTLAGAAAGMPKPVLPAPVQVPALAPGTSTRPVKLTKVVVALKEGEVWQTFGGNIACSIAREEFKWSADKSEMNAERFQATLNEELSRSGFSKHAQDSLFEEVDTPDGYEIGLKITHIESYICGNLLEYYRDTMLVNAEWQIYDPIKREVITRIETSGGVEKPITKFDDVQFVLLDAVRENVRALLADGTFRQVLQSPPTTAPPAGGSYASIILAGAKSAPLRTLADVPGSVVAVFTSAAMGSGFLVSNDGYLITNHHVVGGAKTVRVRWSDGLETTGEVVRSDKRRDVALVKTDPRGRPPLALQRTAPPVGAPVFAVGTPLDPGLQNTVTKGIVSANRFLDGFAYIQSDVGIDHGNSGGPLLDEKGRVIGVTVIKIAPDDGQRGLNLFIPIGDALDFLALKTGP